MTCYCSLEFKISEHILWENPAPNNTAFARPVSLSRAKEEREVLIGELEEIFPYIQDDYTSEQTIYGKHIQICFKTECSMVDGKMVSLLQGDSGAFCHLCTSTRSDANDLQQINNGFIINKDYESCKDAWEKLQLGDISYTSVERYGQCHESIAKCNLHFFSILHFKLRSLDYAQKILYHLVAGQKVWSESGNYASKFIEKAKKKCREHIRETTGMLIDTPTGNGGNTNCGPLADKFFSMNNRKSICELILNKEDHNNYFTMLSMFYILLQVTQSVDNAKLANYEKVKSLGKKLMVHLKTTS